MRKQQRWKKNLQKFCWEYPPFLHYTGISHAESSCAPGMFKKEFPSFEEENTVTALIDMYLDLQKQKLRRSSPGNTDSTHLGGMFSGLLDQSHIQSAFFFRSRSTSFLLSRKSSSD